MAERVLLDNDVALKIACYSLVSEMLTVTTIRETPPGMLGVGRFVVRGRLDRASNILGVECAKTAFEHLLKAVSLIEPDDNELAVAADLEAKANLHGLDLDAGESQLLAILANRACRLLITGDKRAIAAMSVVAPELAAHRIGCLEQLMAHLVQMAGVDIVRARVCAEPGVDRAITACFGCTQTSAERKEVLAGLASYVRHLNSAAPEVLLSGNDLAALAA